MREQIPVIVFPRGQLTSRDKERMTKAGIMAVEADDPKAVCQLNTTKPLTQSVINGDAIMVAAIHAMAKGAHWETMRVFVRGLDAALAPVAAAPTPEGQKT